MGETKWTNEQLSAIKTRNCNLLVAAAAGSGKTAVLVERIIKIITDEENPVDIDKLLVVTFTNAAAAEMRERIANAISKALDENPDSKNLQNQLTLLNRANITTMHSFCLDVIRNNFHKIDLDPSFRIGDQTETILIKSDVIEELFEDRYDNDDQEFIDLVEAFSSYKSDDNLKELILNLYNFIMSAPWPEMWLKESTEAFNISSLDELNRSKWAEVLINSIKVEVEGYIKMYDKAIDIINHTDGLEGYLDNFIDEKEYLERIYKLENNNLEEIYTLLTDIKFQRLKTIKKDKISDEDAQGIVKKIRDDIKKKITDLKDNAFSLMPKEMIESIQGAYPYVKKLSEIILDFGERFSKKKKERNILDFNDLEHLCLKILIDHDEDNNIIPSQVANDFREFFDEVLVDEYQDSNNVQETIINLVSRKELNNPNVFMVGDVKQSIYRFRQANPSLFIDKYNTYKINEGLNRKIQLYKNFRSRKEVIDGVNYIFKELMSDTVGELEYTEEESLNLGASYEISNDESITLGGPIEVNIIEKKDDNIYKDTEEHDESIIDDSDVEITGINLEGKIIAKRIKELMSSNNESKFMVLDKQTGEYRPLKYKDIVILLRATKNYSEVLLEELGEEGIPVYADTGSGYFESIEIRTIMSLLKVIDNPLQDVPILSVLRSPIMGFTAEELTDIRLQDKEKYFYENILCIAGKYDEKSDKVYSDKLIEKCNYFIEKLTEWREKVIYTPIDEFIWMLYMDTAYYGYVGAMPNGVLRQANLKILFQRARKFEETSFKGLFNFINFINRLTRSSGDMGSAKILGENEDVVRIMSIHKSKGLEFPVVFLCGAGKNFNLMDLNKSILYHHELGFGPDFIDLEKRLSLGTLAKEAIKKKMRLETLSEEMRILYVALTRAKEKLIITGCVNDIEKSIEKWFNASILDKNIILPSEVLKGRSYLDWIGIALCKHNDGNILRERIAVSNEFSKDDSSSWKINIISKNELLNEKENEEVAEENELTIKKDEINKELYEEISSRLGYKYPYELATTIKSNISVSDLKKKNIEETVDIEEIFIEKEPLIPKFLQEEKGLTASEKGTIVHLVMKKLNLDKVDSAEDIKLQIGNMVSDEILLEDEAKVVRVNKILKFFNNPLGKRMIEVYKNNPNKLYREVPFYTEISSIEVNNELSEEYKNENIRLQGIIDCFFEEEDKVILIDYKTDYIEEEKEDEFKNKYIKQLEYYSNAIFKIIGKKVDEKYLYSFYLDKYIRLR